MHSVWGERGASPLLANVYRHYVFDLWAQAWRQKQTGRDVIIVRLADVVVVVSSTRR
jgi:RNA-directed DNA polymerase